MTEQDGPTAPGDDALIAAVRAGDLSAYGLLFSRHQEAAGRLARQLTRGGADADDLVAGSFERVMDQLRAGKGPDVAFRAYLLTAMRRLHVDQIRATARVRPTEDTDLDRGVDFDDAPLAAFEHGTAAAAFASLPERWQTVLWHLDVEGEKPGAVAPILGMSANSVSALAYRAREGLRQAYLQQHLREQADDEHQWAIEHLGAYVRKGLSRRDQAKVGEHLDGCARCTAVYLELSEVNSDLGALVGPAVLGAAAAGYLGVGGSKALALVGGWWGSTRGWVAGSTTNAVTAVAGAAAVATLAGGLVYVAATQGADDVASTPSSQTGGSGDTSDPGTQDPATTPGLPGATPPSTSPSALPPALPGAVPPGTTSPADPGTGAGTGDGSGSGSGSGAGSGTGPGSGDSGDGEGGGDGQGVEPGAEPGEGEPGDGEPGEGEPGEGLPGTDPVEGGGETDPEDAPLGATARVEATVGTSSISISWDAVASADGYRVYRSQAVPEAVALRSLSVLAADAEMIRETDAETLRTTDTPANSGDYTYTITALRKGREGQAGAQSSTVRGWLVAGPTDPEPTDPEPTDPEPTDPEPTDPGPLAAPTDVSVLVVGRTVRVRWTGAGVPDGYVVRRNGVDVSRTLDASTNGFDFLEDVDGAHEYTVVAVRGSEQKESAGSAGVVGRENHGALRFHDDYAGGAWCVDASGGVSVQRCAGGTTDWGVFEDETIRTGTGPSELCLLVVASDVALGPCGTQPTRWTSDDRSALHGGVFLTADGGNVLDANGGVLSPGVRMIAYPRKADSGSAGGNDNQRFDLPGTRP
ncbi:MAG: sigma-70 family RNA polymerase sigma factor [Nocardioidaceae bacterium]|nr:sigma-70 family RNA polymerase sigma factor [Nocardioidaceae bacterium]